MNTDTVYTFTDAVVGVQYDSYTFVGSEVKQVCLVLLAKPPSANLTIDIEGYNFPCK